MKNRLVALIAAVVVGMSLVPSVAGAIGRRCRGRRGPQSVHTHVRQWDVQLRRR